jgi:hypothetical protein
VRIPSGARRGERTLRLVGHDVDGGDSALVTEIILGNDDGLGAGDTGPRSIGALARRVRAIARYDGVSLHGAGARTRAFRDDELRIGGQARTTVRVVR